jgi:uncharacterized protein (TIGR03546 family)
MLTLKFLLKFFKILNQDASPRAIAAGMALGAIIGLTPKGSLHNVAVLIILFMLNANVVSGFFAAAVFTLFAYVGDPIFNQLGYALLTADPLQGLWTTLYNTPGVPWTRFNNTLVLGSLTAALILFWPLYFILTWAVRQYRERVMVTIQKWKIVQALKASKLFSLYNEY